VVALLVTVKAAAADP